MNFTADWFTNSIPNFERCMATLPQKKHFLEIGCFEGRSTCWLIKQMEGEASIMSVDTFAGGQSHNGVDFKAVEERFLSNTREAVKGTKVISGLIKKRSYDALADAINHKWVYDFIYIDGSHTAYDTLSDACMAWGILRNGGVMLFDDYEWNKYPEPERNPKLGIDAFLSCYTGQYDLLFKNYQLAVRKK